MWVWDRPRSWAMVGKMSTFSTMEATRVLKDEGVDGSRMIRGTREVVSSSVLR
jgi:hypothetical protein